MIHPIFHRNPSDIKENGRKAMEFISIVHENQKVRAKNSRNEEDSPKMPVEHWKEEERGRKCLKKSNFRPIIQRMSEVYRRGCIFTSSLYKV